MPESETPLGEASMIRNHKELLTCEKGWNLFEELDPLDKDVEGDFRRIANFPFNIKHSNLSTKLFTISTKLLGSKVLRSLRQCQFMKVDGNPQKMTVARKRTGKPAEGRVSKRKQPRSPCRTLNCRQLVRMWFFQ